MRDFIFGFDIEYFLGEELSYDYLREWYHITSAHLTKPIGAEITYTRQGVKYSWLRIAEYDIRNDPPRVIDRQTRYEVLKRQNWRCNNCHEILTYGKNSKWEGKTAHIDHIHPYASRATYKNGRENINELLNLQALCPKCNLTKSKNLN